MATEYRNGEITSRLAWRWRLWRWVRRAIRHPEGWRLGWALVALRVCLFPREMIGQWLCGSSGYDIAYGVYRWHRWALQEDLLAQLTEHPGACFRVEHRTIHEPRGVDGNGVMIVLHRLADDGMWPTTWPAAWRRNLPPMPSRWDREAEGNPNHGDDGNY